jgi:hypothetical protein
VRQCGARQAAPGQFSVGEDGKLLVHLRRRQWSAQVSSPVASRDHTDPSQSEGRLADPPAATSALGRISVVMATISAVVSVKRVACRLEAPARPAWAAQELSAGRAMAAP